MKAYCLASSSSGNCFILEFEIDGMPHRLMVECGIPIKEIYKKLNEIDISLSSIECCLITHAHNDHCKSATSLQSLGMPLFASKGTLKALNLKNHELILNCPNRVSNGIYVLPFEVEHDIDGAVGFVIKTKNECVLFVNDHKRWIQNLSSFKFDYVFIESNYDHKVVYAQYGDLKKQKNDTSLSKKELKEINLKLKQHERNINSHCSLNGTIKGLKKLNLSKCKTIFLMHLSDRYSNEYKMKNTVQDTFNIQTYVCKKYGGIK